MTLQQLVEALYMFYHKPTVIGLELPTRRTKKGKLMPNYELPNDEVDTITIKTQNTAGLTVPFPAGDKFTASSDSPAALNSVIGADAAGNPALVINALVQEHPNITVIVADSAGLTKATLVVDVVQDVAAKNIVLDTADATHVSQPVPASPGP